MTSTRIIKADSLGQTSDYLKQAAQVLAGGGLVIIPTETVYGIAANMLNRNTIARLAEVKTRPDNKPFSLHIDVMEKVEDFATDIPPLAYKLMYKFWPGPITIILKGKDQDTIGIRMPDNEIALRIISLSGVPVVCPSANISGRPAPVTFQDAIRDLNGLVDLAIDAGNTKLQTESSVVDLTVEPMRILREGAIKEKQIQDVAAKKNVLFICTGNTCRSVMAQALLEKRLKEKKRGDVEVISAGIMLLDGSGASREAIEILKKEGIGVSGHRTHRVTREMLREADIILVMEKMHEERVLDLCPAARNKVFLLKEFAKINDEDLDIPDPIGRPLEFYSQTVEIIKQATERISNII